jgi:hypothetical protein
VFCSNKQWGEQQKHQDSMTNLLKMLFHDFLLAQNECFYFTATLSIIVEEVSWFSTLKSTSSTCSKARIINSFYCF